MATDQIGQTTDLAYADNPLRDAIGVIHRRLWIIVVAFLVMTGAAVVISFTMTPLYEASSTLIADKIPPVVLLGTTGQEPGSFRQSVSQPPDVMTLTELVKSEAVRDTSMARLVPPLDPRVASDALGHLSVQQVRNTDLVRVNVRAHDPKVAAAVANAVTDSVIDMDLKARRRLAQKAREFVGEELDRVGRELQESENALTAFKNENHDVSLSEETQLRLRTLAALGDQLTDVRLQQQEARSGSVRPVGSTSQGGSDPVIATLQSQLAALQVELSGLRKQFTPAHPSIISTQAKIEETRKRLDAEISRRQAALAARERELSANIGRISQVLQRVPSREATLVRLTREAKEAERTYLLLSEKLQEARIAEGSIGSAVRAVDSAKVPGKPVRPRRRTNVILGAALGLMLGTVGAYVAEQFDETVRSAEETERLLGAPVLGSIPLLRVDDADIGRDTRALSMPLLLGGGSRFAEPFRILRTHILRTFLDPKPKCFLLTSALPGEGKSTIVANLAVALAQTGRRVLLIDCDLRNSSLGRVFSEADSPGLSGFLAGRAAAETVVRPAGAAGLQCVVSGPTVPHPAELLESPRMAEFMTREARARADVILLDCPAALAVADAEILGLYADGAVVVVRSEKTDRRALIQVRQSLAQARIRLVGAVFNGVAPLRRGSRSQRPI